MSELLTAGEVAERLHLKPLTILQWARRGRIPAIRISHKATAGKPWPPRGPLEKVFAQAFAQDRRLRAIS